jgi:hypothetical protein
LRTSNPGACDQAEEDLILHIGGSNIDDF